MIITDYKLFENLDKAKKLLDELHIPHTNPKFLELKELLKNNMGYMGTFTKWYIKDHESFEKIDEIFKMLKTIQIDKPIEEFEKLEDLYDYIQSYEINKKKNQVINALPSRTRELVNSEFRNLISLNSEYAKHLKDWYSKKGGRYKDIKSLISDTTDFIKNLKGGFNLEAILKKAEGYNVDIVDAKPELLMLRINDYAASKALGSKHWCITTSESMFRSYVTEFTVQYFFYDFTKDISDNKHMIGATISPTGKISNAHWSDDAAVRDMGYFDEL